MLTKKSNAIALLASIVVAFIGINVIYTDRVDAQEPSDAVQVVSLQVEPLSVSQSEQVTVVLELANSSDTSQQFAIAATVGGVVFNQLTVEVAANTTSQTVRFAGPAPGDQVPGTHVIAVENFQFAYTVTSSDVSTGTGGAGSGTSQTQPDTTDDGKCVIRQAMQIRLQNVRERITREQEGSLELSFRNPPVNDCAVDADLRIVMPANLVVFGVEADSGVAGTANTFVQNIAPVGERRVALSFSCLHPDEYLVNFSGTYWPVGNKDDFRPISLHQRFQCVEAISPKKVVTQGPPTPPPEEGENGNGDWNLPVEWVLIFIAVLIVAGIIFVALIGISRRKG